METKTFICHCGSSFNSHTGAIPPGWQTIDGALFCSGCIAVSQRHAPCGDKRLAPTPIRPTERDQATSILLRSGAYLDLADPDCTVIAPIDIASGLRQPRFAAQTPAFYTVAQHSLLVLDLVEPLAVEIGGDSGQALRWCALMHDAAEAFLHDITRPLKIQLPDYRRIEANFEKRLAQNFRINWNDPRRKLVKRADLMALAIERRDLLGNNDRWPVLDSISSDALSALYLGRIWSPEEAEDRFLQAMRQHDPRQLERKAA
jgi:hypothetical protein